MNWTEHLSLRYQFENGGISLIHISVNIIIKKTILINILYKVFNLIFNHRKKNNLKQLFFGKYFETKVCDINILSILLCFIL